MGTNTLQCQGQMELAACERAILQYKYQDKAAYLAADFGSRTGVVGVGGVGVGGDSHATQSRFQITIIGGEKSGTKSDDERARVMHDVDS